MTSRALHFPQEVALLYWADETRLEFQRSEQKVCDAQLLMLGIPFWLGQYHKAWRIYHHAQSEC